MFKKVVTNDLISGSATYLLSNLLLAAIPFALLPIMTRILSPAEYGKIAIFQALVTALAAFAGLSVSGAANRKYYDKGLADGVLKQFIGSCFQMLIISSIFILLLLLAFSESLTAWLNLDAPWVLWALFVSAAGFAINMRLGQWMIRKNANQYGALQVTRSLVNVSLSLLFVVTLALGAEGRILAQVFTVGLFAIIALYSLWKDDLLLIFTWRADFSREILAFGVPLIPHIVGIFLLTTVDRLIVNSELGLDQAGVYVVAIQLSSILWIIFDAFNKAYVPWLFEKLARNVDSEKRQIVTYTYLYFFIALVLSAIAFLVGPPLVVLVAGAEYVQSASIIGWLALGQAFGGMYLMVTNYVFYSKRTGLLSLASIVSGFLHVALLFYMISLIGLEGAAIAFAMSMALRFMLTWWVAQLRHPMPWFSFLSNVGRNDL
ncbi:MAG: oligosaccharide flippase family protein [Halioglobus sp.]